MSSSKTVNNKVIIQYPVSRCSGCRKVNFTANMNEWYECDNHECKDFIYMCDNCLKENDKEELFAKNMECGYCRHNSYRSGANELFCNNHLYKCVGCSIMMCSYCVVTCGVCNAMLCRRCYYQCKKCDYRLPECDHPQYDKISNPICIQCRSDSV